MRVQYGTAVFGVELGSDKPFQGGYLYYLHQVRFRIDARTDVYKRQHYGSVKGSHCLVGKDAEILFAMNAEDRGVPFVYEEVDVYKRQAWDISSWGSLPPRSPVARASV